MACCYLLFQDCGRPFYVIQSNESGQERNVSAVNLRLIFREGHISDQSFLGADDNQAISAPQGSDASLVVGGEGLVSDAATPSWLSSPPNPSVPIGGAGHPLAQSASESLCGIHSFISFIHFYLILCL